MNHPATGADGNGHVRKKRCTWNLPGVSYMKTEENQDIFPVGPDTTKYRLLTKKYVSVVSFEEKDVLIIAPEALVFLADQAMRDIAFLLRPAHLEQVAAILSDPEASDNDRGVAIAMLLNAEVAAGFELPLCQDTGTAAV